MNQLQMHMSSNPEGIEALRLLEGSKVDQQSTGLFRIVGTRGYSAGFFVFLENSPLTSALASGHRLKGRSLQLRQQQQGL